MKIRSTAWFLMISGLVALGSSTPACGGDSDDSGGKGGKGSGGSSGKGASGGTGGSGGTSGTGGTGGGDAGQSECGNGAIEGTEECDDGNLEDGDGCQLNCSFTCVAGSATRDRCDDANACNGAETCGADHVCAAGTALPDGQSCGTDRFCIGGSCVEASCGDNQVQSGEECDDGNASPGDGCVDCKFECVSSDTARNCTPADECAGQGTCNDTTHVCAPGTPLPNDTPCNNATGKCTSGECILLTCGNGTVDTGEQCEPPSTPTCSANCQTITQAVCGNGTIDGDEQCDDSNTANLDGCDSACRYETLLRMSAVELRGDPSSPAFCTPAENRLGDAISDTALGQLNPSLQSGVTQGSTNIIVQALGLDDLTGVADASFDLGFTSGILDPAKGTWPATAAPNDPIDWWFLLEPGTLDTNGVPSARMSSALAARALTAGPSDISMTVTISGSLARLEILEARIRGRMGTATSVPAPPPAALAAGLAVVEALEGNQAEEGLCGNVTVDSLATIAVPEALTTGASACGACSGSKQYTFCGANQPVGPNCNSLLDVIVGGCKIGLGIPCLVTAVVPTQPDVDNGGPTLDPGSGTKLPTAQTAGNKNGYSAYFRFTAKRQHATGRQ